MRVSETVGSVSEVALRFGGLLHERPVPGLLFLSLSQLLTNRADTVSHGVRLNRGGTEVDTELPQRFSLTGKTRLEQSQRVVDFHVHNRGEVSTTSNQIVHDTNNIATRSGNVLSEVGELNRDSVELHLRQAVSVSRFFAQRTKFGYSCFA